MKPSPRLTRATTSVAVIALALGLGACSSGSSDSAGSSNPKSITVWSLENQPDRFAKTKEIAAAFTKESGVKVKVVAIDEGQAPQLIASAAQAGSMPDAIGGASLAFVRQLEGQKLLDTKSAGAVVQALGENTFAPKAVELTRDGDQQLSVPSDAWSQVLVYRKDLFDKAGLAPPTTYDAVEKAAAALTQGSTKGITLATDPADVFTSQTFESLALGNGCQLVTDDGEPALSSPACRTTFSTYGDLATKYSPSGTQTVDTTRASYFAGQAAMVLWSTFILDEMAGLRNDALPTCPECTADPGFLAKNSGVVTSVTGPDGSGAGSFGEITSWALTQGGKAAATKQFVQYMLSDGYLGWIGMAPEGKFPVRTGDASDPQKFVKAWSTLPAGVDTKKPLAEVYSPDTIAQITSVSDVIDRWAIPQGHGDVLGPVVSQLPVSKAVNELATGSTDAAGAAEQADEAVAEIAKSLQ